VKGRGRGKSRTHLGNDPGAEAESRSCGERVARVAAALDLELEAADLVVGVGEGRHRGQVVHVDGAAPELRRVTEREGEEELSSDRGGGGDGSSLVGRKRRNGHRTTTGLGPPESMAAAAALRGRRRGRGGGITTLPA